MFFERCKSLLTSEAVLVHYNSTTPLKLTCDASQHGLGAVLSYVLDGVEHPVAFASRTLNHTDVNYGQIEKRSISIRGQETSQILVWSEDYDGN